MRTAARLNRPTWIAATVAFSMMLWPASGAAAELLGQPEEVAPGVRYQTVETMVPRGVVRAHLLTVDLRHPHVTVDLLTPGVVAARAPISQQVERAGAVAGVNADFFNISNEQPGVAVTGAAAGPAIMDGRDWKAAVPARQRFGPGMPPGATIEHVIGVGVDRVGRVARLTMQGKAFGPRGAFELHGLNQYALPVNGIGVYTSDWGTVSRKRATCGSDTSRGAPCTDRTFEVVLHHGKVVHVAQDPGDGPIPDDAVVLVGREDGADTLRRLEVGDPVQAKFGLGAVGVHVPFRFAVGGFPILHAGAPLEGVNATTAAVRTGAGISADGHTMYLLAVDGRSPATLTLLELALLLRDLGAAEAVNLDGGGSTTLVTQRAGDPSPTVRNNPSGGVQRAVPEGIGVFSK